MNLNLNLNDGREKIYINKELYGEDRVIYVNLTDINILTRANKAKENIEKAFEKFEINENSAIEQIEQADKYIREQVNYIFDYDVSQAVFGNAFATASVGKKFYIEAFLDAILPLIKERIEASTKEAEKRVSKYTDKYKKQ